MQMELLRLPHKEHIFTHWWGENWKPVKYGEEVGTKSPGRRKNACFNKGAI